MCFSRNYGLHPSLVVSVQNMASACALEWVPDSLYNTAVSAIVTYYSRHRKELKALPENVQFDIYYKLYNKGRLCQLGLEFSELDTFARVLKVNDKRHLLHHCFQALMDHGVHVADILAETFSRQYTPLATPATQHAAHREKAIQLGFSLGGFLNDAGWIRDAERAFLACLQLCRVDDTPAGWCRTLECCVRLVHVRNANCTYDSAELSCKEAEKLVEQLEDCGISVNKATLYSERCALLFAKSQYDEAYKYCCMALHEISHSMSPKAIVDVLRQGSKACVVKREFVKAEVLIRHAVHFAKENFGVKHPKYSDALLDYGFYLLNVDSISAAVSVYQTALDIRQTVFGGNNLHMAIAHEDLAYASYVHEYSSGRFRDARGHAEKAIEIIGHILPEDHLLLSSSKRVKALILEEIAIDTNMKEAGELLLQEAQELHLQSLALAKLAFGENNVQTAKHYGNLGRLYQSMRRFNEAEQMHLKAIEIKERLLGVEDYEVALSVGHLASLYNYDMAKYEEAEKLYLRSISIGKKLFGDGYSGLEYDYRGLMRLYQNQGDFPAMERYRHILQDWSQIRDVHNAKEEKPLDFVPFLKLLDMIRQYFG